MLEASAGAPVWIQERAGHQVYPEVNLRPAGSLKCEACCTWRSSDACSAEGAFWAVGNLRTLGGNGGRARRSNRGPKKRKCRLQASKRSLLSIAWLFIQTNDLIFTAVTVVIFLRPGPPVPSAPSGRGFGSKVLKTDLQLVQQLLQDCFIGEYDAVIQHDETVHMRCNGSQDCHDPLRQALHVLAFA